MVRRHPGAESIPSARGPEQQPANERTDFHRDRCHRNRREVTYIYFVLEVYVCMFIIILVAIEQK